jgi:hypothetical protein
MDQRVLEKLTVTPLVKKFLAFYGTRRFITVFTPSRHWFLSWARWIQSIPSQPCLPKICSYVNIYKSVRTESITKYTLTFGIARWEATQSVMAANLTRLTHRITIQLHLLAESCTICSSRSRRPVRKLWGTPSYLRFKCRIFQLTVVNWSATQKL